MSNRLEALALAYDQTDLEKADKEHIYNVLGYFPFLSTLSGTVRMIDGIFSSFYYDVSFDADTRRAFFAPEDSEERALHAINARKDNEYEEHAHLNIGRGIIEFIPFVNLTGLAYDLMGARVKYTAETGSNIDRIREYTDMNALKYLQDQRNHQETQARLADIQWQLHSQRRV